MTKPALCPCEQKGRRSVCATVLSGQRLHHLVPKQSRFSFGLKLLVALLCTLYENSLLW